jgi:hypothetical protein
LLPSLLADCKKIRCFDTIGDELPFPGTATFQSRFCFSPKATGMPVSLETPVPFGPRNRGQSEAAAEREIAQARQKANSRHRRWYETAVAVIFLTICALQIVGLVLECRRPADAQHNI